MRFWHKVLLLAIVPVTFFTAGLLTLSDYGVNTDEPFHFMRGQAYLHYYLTGSKTYDNLDGFAEHIARSPVRKDGSTDNPSSILPEDAAERNQPETKRFSAYQQPSFDAASLIATDVGHPPLGGILAAGFNKVFYQQLGWLGDIESYHLFEITVATLGILLVMWWAYLEFGFVAALFAGLALALHPMYLGESRFNIKDPIETVFFATTLFALGRAVQFGREKYSEDRVLKWLLAAGLAFGAALATKFNALFVLPIVGLWFVGMLLTALLEKISPSPSLQKRGNETTSPFRKEGLRGIFGQWFNVGTLWGVPLALILAAGVVYAAWPNLWGQALDHLTKVSAFYLQLGTSEQYTQGFLTEGGWNLYPLLDVLLRAPLVTLLLAAIGLAGFVRYWRTPHFATLLLWAIWLTVPILRVTLPGKALYGATRQIMEYLPALSLFAGVGAAMIVESIAQRFKDHTATERFTERHGKILPNPPLQKEGTPLFRKEGLGEIFGGVSKLKGQRSKVALWVTAVLILSYLPIVVTLTRLHPNPQLFYNSLIGGLKGAHDVNFPFWDNTMNNAYVEGIKWLNANAEPQAHLSMVTALRSSLPPHKLRDDIDLSNHYFSGPFQEGEYIMEILPIPETSFIPKYINKFLAPVYTYEVDGVPLLAVWHNDGKHRAADSQAEAAPIEAKLSTDGTSLTLDFGTIQTFQRLEFITPPASTGCSALTEGAVSISSDGKTYKRLENIPFVGINRPEFQTHDVPDYLLAGDQFRFVSISPNAGACLLKATPVKGWISD